MMETLIVGERGQITIPQSLRKKYGIKPKQPVVIEDREGEIVIKPAIVIPLDQLKTLVKEYDEKFLKELIEASKVSAEEERKIIEKWLAQKR